MLPVKGVDLTKCSAVAEEVLTGDTEIFLQFSILSNVVINVNGIKNTYLK